jgi:hypothetical protein
MIKRLTTWVGVIGTVVFTLTFVLLGFLRSDYDPLEMYVSELSLGSKVGFKL